MLATKQQALPRVVISQRRRVRIHALDEQDVGVAAPKEDEAFSFGPNSRSGVGYIDGDSAGQTNIFAKEPKLYVQDSDADTTDTSVSTRYVVTAASMALVLGLLVARFSVQDTFTYDNAQPLSAFAARFAAELS